MSLPYSDPLEAALSRELRSGERVLWKGRPLSRVKWAAFAIYLFAIPWTAFSVFWTVMAAAGIGSMEPDGAGALAWAFPLFGLPFIAVGIGMMAAPFLPLFLAGKTVVAVTDRRIVQITLGRRLVTRSTDVERLGQITRSEGRDGAGSLSIATGSYHDSDGDRRTDRLEIGEIADVMRAETIIRDMRDRYRRSVATAISS